MRGRARPSWEPSPPARPQVAPVWFVLDGEGAVVFTTGAAMVKGRSLRRDPRVCLCVDEEAPPYAFVMVDGTAGLVRTWRRCSNGPRASGPVHGRRSGDEYGRRNAVVGELLVRVTPTRVVARAGVAD